MAEESSVIVTEFDIEAFDFPDEVEQVDPTADAFAPYQLAPAGLYFAKGAYYVKEQGIRKVTYPAKNNLAVRAIDADWYFLGADDISFPENWWDDIMACASGPTAQVIGTNDGGNSRTTGVGANVHSTHTAVSAEYVKRGSIDSDDLLCAFFWHWCVDDEFVHTAMQRLTYVHSGVLVPCRHPYWQTAEMDDTYRRGEAHAAEDMALWKQRAKDLLGLDVT